VFATDRWITGPVLGYPKPFHPLGYACDSGAPEELAPLDLNARPSLHVLSGVRDGRAAFVEDLVRDRNRPVTCTGSDSPNGGTTTVGVCIRVVMIEE
jgi:hypothetical protein